MQTVQMYRTSDGQVFEDAKTANLHEEKIQASKRVDNYLEEVFGGEATKLTRGQRMRKAMMRRIILGYLTHEPQA